MKKILPFIILFCSISCLDSKGMNYYATFFKKGLPANVNRDWPNAIYAEVGVAEHIRDLYIILQDTAKIKDELIIAYSFDNKHYVTSFMSIDDDNHKSITLKTADEDELENLELKFMLDKNLLLYRWGEDVRKDSPIVIKEYPYKKGNKFPSISIEMENGKINTKDLKGKTVVINWWATSCHGSIIEIPDLNKLVEKYKDNQIEFISIVNDKYNLKKFLKTHPFIYQHGYASSEHIEVLGHGVPRNIIIDQNGYILFNESGGAKDTYKKLGKILDEIYK